VFEQTLEAVEHADSTEKILITMTLRLEHGKGKLEDNI
jgi:hypothetical protein